jgi:hypothetical protein
MAEGRRFGKRTRHSFHDEHCDPRGGATEPGSGSSCLAGLRRGRCRWRPVNTFQSSSQGAPKKPIFTAKVLLLKDARYRAKDFAGI